MIPLILPIQINGKRRAEISVRQGSRPGKDQIEALAMAKEAVQSARWMGKNRRKSSLYRVKYRECRGLKAPPDIDSGVGCRAGVGCGF